MPKITPFLWFDKNLAEAIDFYRYVFDDLEVIAEATYGPGMPGGFREGHLMSATFEIKGNRFMGLNGGPRVAFNDAVSFFVNCLDQSEVDRYWDRLLEGGTPSMCGWITDQFGVTWQIVPDDLFDYIGGQDPAGAAAATQAMLSMQKLELSVIKAAYDDAAAPSDKD